MSALVLGLIVPSETRTSPSWPVELQSEVVALARTFDGELGLFVQDLSSEVRYSHNAATPFYLASVVKVAVMLEVHRQVEAGELRLDDTIVVTPETLRDGSGAVKRTPVGTELSIAELMNLMMTISDNGATDMLMERVGLEQINQTLNDRGFGDFHEITSMLDVRHRIYAQLDARGSSLSPQQVFAVRQGKSPRQRAALLSAVLQKEEPISAQQLNQAYDRYYATLANSASMEAMGALLATLGRGELVSKSASAAMIDLMTRCKTGKRRLRGLLPKEAVLAHKTGTQHRRACNVGLLILEQRRVVIAACAKNFARRSDAEQLMASIGKHIYDLFVDLPLPEPVGPPDAEPLVASSADPDDVHTTELGTAPLNATEVPRIDAMSDAMVDAISGAAEVHEIDPALDLQASTETGHAH